MRVKLNSPHNWIAPDNSQHDYKPGEYTVTRECGEEMIAAGKATEILSYEGPSASGLGATIALKGKNAS